MAKKDQTPADLERQLGELQKRLAGAEKSIESGDPTDVGKMAGLYAERQALQGAIAEVSRRLEAARLEQASQLAAQREQERQERAASARLVIEKKARAVCDAVRALDSGALAELEAAARELQMCGAVPDRAQAAALEIGQVVDRALAGWRTDRPAWLDLPEPPSREELALQERRAAVARAEERLAEYRKMRANMRHGGATVSGELIKTMAYGVVGTRRSLLALTEPGLDEVAIMNKCYGGINELADDLGRWHEARIDAERKRQREEQAGLLA